MKKILMVHCGIFLCVCLYAQEKTVSGIITAFDDIPVADALIQVKSTDEKFYTDSVGTFTIQCANTDKLLVSAKGFFKSKIKIKAETKFVAVNMKLRPGDEAKELAVGYGHVKDKNKLYAVTGRNDGYIDYSHYHSIYDALEGNFTGVQIINGDVIIRNTSTFSESYSAALLVIDGRVTDKNDFGNIATSDIARISILKDASAAIYGARGANGVVIVETKRGKAP